MNILVFTVDGKITRCHHITFYRIPIAEIETDIAILGNNNYEQITTLLVREILSIQYEEVK